ncbi:MAG TPA: YihY/virulence factor BrkB family protein [Tissierellaceae bacterium]|nr:YihY/virulence factor BrkB family protein [Tissierellaceae bacterium]
MGKAIELLRKKHSEKNWFLFLDELLYRYEDDGVSEIGAQLTYYLILAIFPFLIFFLSILKYTPLSDVQVLETMLSVLPGETQNLLYNLINEIMEKSNFALLSIGALGAIWSSSKGILSIIKAVNRAFDLEEDRPFWKLRGLAIVFTIALFFILVIAFSILIFGEVLFDIIINSYNLPFLILWKIMKVLIPLVFMTLIFSILYKFSPSIKEGVNVKLSETIPGSIFASTGIILFSVLFSFYVNGFGNYTNTYGSLGGIIILLIWIYAISIVIVLGAEINATLISQKNKI